MKRVFKYILCGLIVPLALLSCQKGQEPSDIDRPIVIIYDNDVNCAVDGYPRIAGLRDAIAAADTAYVALVSSGDFIQGGIVGSLSKGADIIRNKFGAHIDAKYKDPQGRITIKE